MRRVPLIALIVSLVGLANVPFMLAVTAQDYNPSFAATWARTDEPVVQTKAQRTWMWGPPPFGALLVEPYAEAPGGTRLVQYYDKSRMEITDPKADRSEPWFVTNGLLVKELITGDLQAGDNTFEHYQPAVVNVAGDPDDAESPTYATFAGLLEGTVGFQERVIKRGITREGTVYNDDRFAAYGIGAAQFVSDTQHWVAQPFWDFMNSSGLIYEGGTFSTGPIFENPYYATGFPISEAFWAEVRVDGVPRDVLMQCFERRCLTYTPDNPEGWKVEAGNVGQHYYRWRYEQIGKSPELAPDVDTIDYDCVDFATKEDAQRYFLSQGGSPSNNIDALDNNHNGIACEIAG